MNTGGPAFPVPDSHHANGQVQYGANGMTLLDWMAGQALANSNIEEHSGKGWPDRVASQAYDIAAAMLAEKARREADHSPDAGKMDALEAANRELAEELEKLANAVELFTGYGPEVRSARATLAKHKGAA